MSAIVWCCDVCSEPIRDGDGWLSVTSAEIHAYEQAVAAWEDAHASSGDGLTAEELMTYPEPAPWRVLHRRCDPDPEASSYWISIEEFRTPSQVLWTAHLLEKSWLPSTTWRSVLRMAMRQRSHSRSATEHLEGR